VSLFDTFTQSVVNRQGRRQLCGLTLAHFDDRGGRGALVFPPVTRLPSSPDAVGCLFFLGRDS